MSGALRRGALLGAAASAPVVGAEFVLVAVRFGGGALSAREIALLFVALAGVILWPATLLGAAAGGLLQRVRPGAGALRVLAIGAAAALALGVVSAVAFPELLSLRPARIGLLVCGWAVAWGAGWWMNIRSGGSAARAALSARAGSLLLIFGLWAAAFVAARWDAAPLGRAALVQYAPLSGALVDALQRGTDLDGDGFSGLFGGGDCGALEPALHPGAFDLPGNGIDEDCDGADADAREIVQAAAGRVRAAREDAMVLAARSRVEPDAPAEPLDAVEPPPGPTLARAPILLLTVDTLRPDVLGLYGASPSPTPHLDRIGADALVFERTWAQGPMTKASVASLLSGRYFSEVERSKDAWVKLLPGNATLAESLQALGYRTVGITSHPYLADLNGYAQGFERLHNLSRERFDQSWYAEEVVDRAIGELRELLAGEAPFLLWVHIIDPHHPYIPHASLREASPLPGVGFAPDASKWDRYRAEVAWTDRQIGRFWESAEKLQGMERVLVLIHADHGEGFGEHGYDYHGQSLFEDQLRVPLIARGPQVVARRVEAPVMLLDLHATALEIAGGGPLPARAGPGGARSLVGVLRGEEAGEDERAIFAEMVPDETHSSQKMVMQWPWKLIASETHNTWQLYRIDLDPGERENLYSAQREEAGRLRGLLRRFERDSLRALPPR